MSFATKSFEFIYLYACLLLFGRWLTIYLINFISVHLMTAIFNLQFVWFVIIGYVVFSDVPSDVVWIGAIVLIGETTAVALCEYRESKERQIKEKSLSRSHMNWMHLGFQSRTSRRSIRH